MESARKSPILPPVPTEKPPGGNAPLSRWLPAWRDALIALACGATFYWISTPRTLDFLQWLVWVPLLVTLGTGSPRRDFLLGWLGGIALNVAGFNWIVHTITLFSNLPLPVAWLAMGLFAAYGGLPYALFGLAYPRVKAVAGPWSLLLVPALWVALEFTFPMIFPYHQGDLQFRNLPIYQVASVLGVAGLSFLVMLVNTLGVELWQAARGRRPVPWAPAGLVLVGMAGIWVWGHQRVASIDAQTQEGVNLKVGLIQGNYGVHELRRTTRAEVFDRYRRLSGEAVRKGASLLIWGEGASPYSPPRDWDQVEGLVRELNVDLLAGGSGRDKVDGKVRFFNSVYALRREGGPYQRYDKNVLLAFGEYMPGSKLFPWLKGKIKGIGDYTPGEDVHTLSFDPPEGPVRAFTLICYESILDDFVRKHMSAEPNLLITVSHDDWFGDTACPHQFLMLSAGRAVEHGVSIARVANTGISAVIDPTGRIRGQTPLFKQAATVETVSLLRFATSFGYLGLAFQLLCCGVALVTLVWYRRKQLAASR